MTLSAAHALCVYAEPLAAHRRVVVVGDSSLGLDARLVAMGARVVHVLDPDGERARENGRRAARGVIVRELPLDSRDIDVREGAFDLAVVPDLAAFTDRAALLARVRKLVGPEGAALVAAPSSLDYYEMYDLVALQFASVRMVAQVPFAGVALAELGESDEAPAVSVDTQLAGEPEAPEVFVALCAQRDVRLEPYAIIQLPREAADDEEEPVAEERAPTPSAHAELASAVLRANLLESQLEEQRAAVQQVVAKLKDAETRAGEHYVRAERVAHEARRLEEELARRSGASAEVRERVALLEEALRVAEEATLVLQARAVESESALAERDAQIAALARVAEDLRALAAQPRVSPEAFQACAARAEQAEARAVVVEAQLAELHDAQGAELAGLERMLRERAQTIASLEREIVRREALVHELVSALEEAGEANGAGEGGTTTERSPHGHAAATGAIDELRAHLRTSLDENEALRSKLDALALEVARREGELQARTWRIAELEERVASLESQARPAPARAPEGPRPHDGDGTRAELVALRQALAQEHEARVRAESGEELARARADLARQATLLDQLARELEAERGARVA